MSEQAVRLQRVVADFDLAVGEQAVESVAFVDASGEPIGLDGGSVASVNGKTGAVVLSAEDIDVAAADVAYGAGTAEDALDAAAAHEGNAAIHVPAPPTEGAFVLTATDGVIAWVASE